MNQDEQREQLRQQRRDAYQAAKERQRTDPKYIALKEKQKVMRRESYQQQKQQRTNFLKAEKRAKQDEKAMQKEARDEALAQSIFRAKDLIAEDQSTFQREKYP